MAFAPAGGEAALGAWTLVAFLGFVVCFGLLQAWRHTIGAVFRSVADKKIGLKWVGSIKPLSFLGSIDNAVEATLSDWASGFQKQYGLAMHYMAEFAQVSADELAKLGFATHRAETWVINRFVPRSIARETNPLKKRANQAAAAAGAAAAAAVVARNAARSHAHSEAGSTATTKADATHAAKTAANTTTVTHTIERTVTHNTKVITQYIDAGALPAQFGRTVTSIRRRLSRAEAWVGAGALSIAMANVLGLPNPRCLRDGPIGKVARRLCGLGSGALNELLGLLVDVLIVEDICQVVGLLEQGLEVIQGPIDEIVGVVGGSLCNGDYEAPPAYGGFTLSLPPVTGLVLSGV